MKKSQQVAIAELADEDGRWLQSVPRMLAERGGKYSRGELTRKEWQRVRRVVKACQLPCEMRSDCLGYLFFVIYRHPAALGIKPELAVSLSMESLPGFSQIDGDYNDRFGFGWKTFSPITHSKRNKELLALYGLEPVKEETSYRY